MALSEKKRQSNEKWIKENYRQVKLSMPKEEAETLDSYCSSHNISKAGFIRAAIKEKMDRESQEVEQVGGSPLPDAPTQAQHDITQVPQDDEPYWKRPGWAEQASAALDAKFAELRRQQQLQDQLDREAYGGDE